MSDENSERIREIDELREKFDKEKSEMREKIEKEKSELVSRLEKENADLKNQLNAAKVRPGNSHCKGRLSTVDLYQLV